MKKQEIKLFITFGNPELQTIKNFSRNCKTKFGSLEQNLRKPIIDSLHFGIRQIRQTLL